MQKYLIAALVTAAICGCSSGGGSGSPAAATAPERQVVAIRQAPGADGSTQVTVHSLATAGPIVTLAGDLSFDNSRLTLKDCQVSPQIDQRTAAGKSLTFGESSPGVIGTVVWGGLETLPGATDVFTCTFVPASNAPEGAASVSVSGDVADETFVDRHYVADATITAN